MRVHFFKLNQTHAKYAPLCFNASSSTAQNIDVWSTAAIGSTVFYAADTGAGQAGVFVVNPASTNEELVTKRRAFGFSLLL
jgi:hypothetical protein